MRRNDIDLGRLIKKFWSTVRYPDNRLLVQFTKQNSRILKM